MKTQTPTAREIFKMEFKGQKNFMTPDVLKLGKITRDLAYEISSGRGFDNKPIFGVTLVRWLGEYETGPEYDLSQMFHSLGEAENYVEELKESQHEKDQ